MKTRLGLGEIGSLLGLAWGSSLTVLNTKHVLVWIFEFLGPGVTKKSQPVGSWEGKMLKPINFEKVLRDSARRDDVGTNRMFLIEEKYLNK